MKIQRNLYRDVQPMSGIYGFSTDPEGLGETERWFEGLPNSRPIAVPASWNEQYQDLDDYVGTGWYERLEFIPPLWQGRHVLLRVGAAYYYTKVWVNGTFVGEHEGGSLPFDLDVTDCVHYGQSNRIVFSVDAEPQPDRLPPGNFPLEEWNWTLQGQFPPNNYDFYPYGGIHRPVYLLAIPEEHIQDIIIRTTYNGNRAQIAFEINANTSRFDRFSIFLDNELRYEISGGNIEGIVEIDDPILWEPGCPHLYNLKVQAKKKGQVVDEYAVPIGIRTIEVKSGQLLLNGKPVFLKGFGKHEDFMISGKGLNEPVMVKDYNLLRWIGANSYRTSHYPYSEEMMDMADQLGVLVIDESPLVGLMRRNFDSRTLQKSKAFIREMILRDRNHPSVIMWSVANEPKSNEPEAAPFFKELYDYTRSLDDSRPVTMATGLDPTSDLAVGHFDVISLNKYYGWYTYPGRLDEADRQLAEELEQWHAKYDKPIFISEFGADAISGLHYDPPRQFSEEYQAEMLIRQYQLFENMPFVIGAHVWAFADFKTSQIYARVLLNRKGVFTRERQPKLAAHALRRLWSNPIKNKRE